MSDRIEVTEEKKDHSDGVITVSEESPESLDTAVNNEHPEEENNQSIQVDLALRLLEVGIDNIIKYDLIPDYITKTSSKYPYLVETPNGSFCLDGYNLVEEARAQGCKNILVYIELWKIHSDDELSRRKIEIRNVSDFGKVFYIETMRHIAYRKKSLLEDRPELIEFRQGMSGKGIDNSAKLHHWLAKEKNMDEETVSKYLTHLRYLSMDALDTLVEFQKKPKGEEIKKYPNKDFFEEVNSLKINFVDSIEPLKLGYDVNEERVSKMILEQYDKYRKGEKIEKIENKAQVTAKMIKSVNADLFTQIMGENNSTKDSTTKNKETEKEKDESDKGKDIIENSANGEIKKLAEELWKLADEQIDIDEKKDKYNDYAQRLLLIVARI